MIVIVIIIIMMLMIMLMLIPIVLICWPNSGDYRICKRNENDSHNVDDDDNNDSFSIQRWR